MKKLQTLTIALMGVGLMLNTASGAEKTFDLDTFKQIQVNSRADLDVKVGGKQSVKIVADQNVLDRLKIMVKGDTLVIKRKKNGSYEGYSRGKTPKITVSVALLEKLTINGSSDANVKGIKGDSFALRINGSGDVDLSGKSKELDISVNGSGDVKAAKYQADEIEASISGSGDIALAGKCKNLELRISGSGDFSGKNFKCSEVKTRISGSGDVVIFASQSVDIRSSGSSDVEVFGNPKKIKNRSSGSSDLNVH